MRQIDLQAPNAIRSPQFRLQHLTSKRPSREHTGGTATIRCASAGSTQQITHRIRGAHPTISELAVLIQPPISSSES